MQHEREDLLLEILEAFFPVFTAVHEDVVLPGVGVQVAVERDPDVILDQFAYELLHVVNCREGILNTNYYSNRQKP